MNVLELWAEALPGQIAATPNIDTPTPRSRFGGRPFAMT
jgi:hypothetical protein